ncbi:MAG TPA: alkaline phosphatase family protein [Janthinobacterium sp.]|nr:alkaline phosphatase family protein [Janthinobacterium sp.]
MPILDDIRTIVIVMMENRSFDNVLGHISTPLFGNRTDIAGLIDPDSNPAYINILDGLGYRPQATDDNTFAHDLPHGRARVATQMAQNGDTYTMSGFVLAYRDETGSRVAAPPPMGYLTPKDVPMSHFLAQNYMVCDHWHAPVPADTQPNRSIAFSGYTLVDNTTAQILPVPAGSFIFDWLNTNKIDWRVYHSGLSFFMLFERYLAVNGANFRDMPGDLMRDIANEPVSNMPQVIFIEPEYTDSPVHIGAPNDYHPPTGIGPGEHFLGDIYNTLTKNPEKWVHTLLVITCDEHGGFFDHVPPPAIGTPLAAGARYATPFSSLGPRVPALLVSPRLAAKSVYGGTMDHTSILQLLAEKFTPGRPYNAEVERRRRAGIQSLSQALKVGATPVRKVVPAPPVDAPGNAALAAPAAGAPEAGNAGAFTLAARNLLAHDRAATINQYPALLHLPEA